MKTINYLIIAAALGILSGCATKTQNAVYEYTQVSRGDLEKTVSASGTLNPVATVKVLPQMSGKVEQVYATYNGQVQIGQVLAELNTDMLKLQREQQLAQVIKARANYELQLLNYQNQEKLAEKNLISSYDLKSSKTTLDIQQAELTAAEASLLSIETEINQYAYITSPIDGIILDRSITVGDTVVSSSGSSGSSAIFTIAENLTEMQIESWIGEMDIASIYEGQQVRFSLESLPGRSYSGTVESKRLMPSVQDNVVSYCVIIDVENYDGSLLPGMTCAVEFIEERSENILLAPNAALRFDPPNLSTDEKNDIIFNAGLKGMSEEQKAAATATYTAQKQSSSATETKTQSGIAALTVSPVNMQGPGMMGGGRPAQTGAPTGTATQTQPTAVTPMAAATVKPLWYTASGGKLDVILVYAGSSDGSRTEIRPVDGQDIEGLNIILKERVQA
jgi:HlyD family secretion protein